MPNWKEFRKREFSRDAFCLEHPDRRDFYVSCWQQGTSAFPLLLLRALQCSVALSIWLSSFLLFDGSGALWFIYLTHWGLSLLVVTTAVGTLISAFAYFKKMPDVSLGVAWQERGYWMLYNTCAPVAFLITIFYWAVLYTHPDDSMEDYDPQLALDVCIHGVNSLLVLSEVAAAAVPSRLLHAAHPLAFGAAYALFGGAYHLAGGVNRSGEPWVYPVINWAAPAQTVGVLAGTGAGLALLHVAVVGAAGARGRLARALVPAVRAPGAGATGRYVWPDRSTAVV